MSTTINQIKMMPCDKGIFVGSQLSTKTEEKMSPFEKEWVLQKNPTILYPCAVDEQHRINAASAFIVSLGGRSFVYDEETNTLIRFIGKKLPVNNEFIFIATKKTINGADLIVWT